MKIFTVFDDTDPDRLVATRTPCRQCKRQQTRRIDRDVWRLLRWHEIKMEKADGFIHYWYDAAAVEHLFEPDCGEPGR